MKNKEPQELNPIYIRETSYPVDDSVNLVDLAMILIRRKSVIAFIFTTTMVLGLVVALLMPRTYTFSTSIEIGSQIIKGAVKPFESPETLQAKLTHSFIPNILNVHRVSIPEDEQNYNITASIPKSSQIIVLEIKGTEDQSEVINNLLQKTSKKAIQDHNRIYEAVKQNFVASRNKIIGELASLDSKEIEQTEKIQLLNNRIESYNSQLANLRKTREILPPMKSIEATGTGKRVIVTVTAFIGIFLAVFAAFFAEFIAKVKEAG